MDNSGTPPTLQKGEKREQGPILRCWALPLPQEGTLVTLKAKVQGKTLVVT